MKAFSQKNKNLTENRVNIKDLKKENETKNLILLGKEDILII